MSNPTSSCRRKPIPKGTRADAPAWLTPEARAEIRSAAAEWSAGTPATQTDESRVDDHDPEAAARMIAGLYRAGPRALSAEDLLIWMCPGLGQPGAPQPRRLTTWMNLGTPEPWPVVGRGRPRSYDGKDQYAHHACMVAEVIAEWARRLRGEHYRRSRLPNLRRGSGREQAQLIAEIARQLVREGTPRHGRGGLAVRIQHRLKQLAADSAIRMLARPGTTLAVPHRTTIERVLKVRGF